MKKLFLILLGVAFVVGVHAQDSGLGAVKVNVEKLKSAIAKSDAEIANVKKAAKAATWIKRGNAFLNAETVPVSGLYLDMPESMLKLAYGEAPSAQQVMENHTYTIYTYDHFKAYVENGLLAFWVTTSVIDPAGLDKAFEAFNKAYELDAKSAEKVKAGMEALHDKSFENGGAYYALQDFKTAANNFRRAYESSAHPSVNVVDVSSLYYAGMSNALADNFADAIKYLDQVLEKGYDADGDAYRFKFLAMYNSGEREPALDVLKKGLSLYPANEAIIDLMMKYYAENDGDPSSIIPIVEDAITKNPTNPSLYQGLARVYDKLGRIDEAMTAIQKSLSLKSDDFYSNYLHGLFFIKKGDGMIEDLRKTTITSRAQSDQANAAIKEVFTQALAPLEKAHQLDPSQGAIVELLKNLTFRLSDDNPEMEAKYKRYSDMLNLMNN